MKKNIKNFIIEYIIISLSFFTILFVEDSYIMLNNIHTDIPYLLVLIIHLIISLLLGLITKLLYIIFYNFLLKIKLNIISLYLLILSIGIITFFSHDLYRYFIWDIKSGLNDFLNIGLFPILFILSWLCIKYIKK
jgi:hypothetical protein